MSDKKMAGVTAFARILAGVAHDGDLSVGRLADREGLVRSTAFDVIKRMQAADLVAKSTGGTLVPGRTAGAFAYSFFGLGSLFGPAEPLLIWLRNETNSDVALQARENPEAPYVDLLTYLGPPGARLQPVRVSVMHQGITAARLSVIPHRAGMSPTDCLERASDTAAALEEYLDAEIAVG